MIRAEAASKTHPYARCMVEGELAEVFRRPVGLPATFSNDAVVRQREVACVTCGKCMLWDNNAADCGHAITGRDPSILFNESGVAIQCKYCNRTGGRPELFRRWIIEVRSEQTWLDLVAKKREVKQWTKQELVRMRISYLDRTNAAIKRMNP